MDKVNNLLSSKKFRILLLAGIIFLGFCLRIVGIYKFGGFWYDDAYSFYVAKQSFPFGILEKLYNEDAHAPLYFLLLNLWMKVFGIHDVTIRLFSVLSSLLVIPVFYLLGKELLSRKLGFTLAIFACVNSFLFFYSQEIRFYSLTVLLGTLSLLFLVKIYKKPCLRNYILLVVTNLLLLYTLTIAFIFVFAESIVFLAYLYVSKRADIKHFILAGAATLVLYLPYVFFIIHQSSRYASLFINPFKVFMSFNYASFLVVLQSWFTPVLDGLNITAPNLCYYEEVFSKGIGGAFIIFVIIPATVALIGIIKTLSSKNRVFLLLLIGIIVLFIELMMTFAGKIAIISRYLILVFPIFLIAAGYGLVSIKNKLISSSLILLFVFINLFYLVSSPVSVIKKPQSEGYRTVAEILKQYDLNSKDILLMPADADKFLSKYYPVKNISLLDFNVSDAIFIKNEGKILDKKLVSRLTQENAYDLLRYYLYTSGVPERFEDYIKSKVVDKLEKDRFFITVQLGSARPFNEELLRKITLNDKIYKDLSLYFLLSSKFSINLYKIEQKYFEPVAVIKKSNWEVHILKKRGQ